MRLPWSYFTLGILLRLNAASSSTDITDITNEIPSSSEEFTLDIPDPAGRIINGFLVKYKKDEFPWIVALYANNSPFCTGSLINSQYILTAAHCVVHNPTDSWGREMCNRPFIHKKHPFQAVIGEDDLRKAMYKPGKVHQVIEHWIHNRYRCSTHTFDFAILKLRSPVSITPVCLDSGMNTDNKQVYALGYGATTPYGGANMSKDLRMVLLFTFTNKKCSTIKKWYVAPSMICAEGGNGAVESHFSGTCHGDSGGPLVIYNEYTASFIQIGVTQGGDGDKTIPCQGNTPNHFGRVSSALPFIRSKARSIKTCRIKFRKIPILFSDTTG